MRKFTLAAAAALVVAGFSINAASAETTLRDCRTAAEQVKTALDGKEQSGNYDDAVKHRNMGRDFCTHGMYAPGVSQYQEALRLIGASNG
ncbi:MAG: hypothetical protein GC166_12685 [Alphaproteobacteria bacterium]|nr:hypothetical protein [Alphaproteobacteria bacterium]